jgi:hypothetical protein
MTKAGSYPTSSDSMMVEKSSRRAFSRAIRNLLSALLAVNFLKKIWQILFHGKPSLRVTNK